MEILIISKEDSFYSSRERIYGRKIKYTKNIYPSSFSPHDSGWAGAVVYFEDEPKQEYYFIDVLFDDKDFINKFVLGKTK